MKLPRLFSSSGDPETARDRYYLWIGVAACAVVFLLTFVRGGGQPAKTGQGAEQQVLTSSVDIKENDKQYTVTVALATKDTSQIQLRMEGDTLHLISGAVAGARYDQTFLLPQAAIGSQVTVNRQKDRLVLNVPKADNRDSVTQAASLPADPFAGAAHQMAQMQRMMAQVMQGGRMNALSAGFSGGARMNLEETSDNYLVHLQIPKEEQKNVKIAVDNDRVLKITSTQENASGGANGAVRSFSTSNYSQAFTLPGPVQSDKIKMAPEGDNLLITLPKA